MQESHIALIAAQEWMVNDMGQALEMCVHCENKRGCDNCTDLNNWIMEHLEPKQKWISVKDRLPEQYAVVIVYDGEQVGEAEFNGVDFGWVESEDLAFATHWTPLPEPPKEED